jgi:5,10-methylene-tetrahydrofolate dehydrogenase/methenyl tetrahydrofolate cyclohydrolase
MELFFTHTVNLYSIDKRKPTLVVGCLEFLNMCGIDKHGKHVEITAKSSLVGRSFHSITIECVDDLKILSRVQGR